MREYITERLPSVEWISTWSWRVGVTLLLILTNVVAVVAAYDQLASLPTVGRQAISTAMQAGHVLIALGITLPALGWTVNAVRGVDG